MLRNKCLLHDLASLRAAHATGPRARGVQLTRKGARMLGSAGQDWALVQSDLEQRLGPQQRAQLTELLTLLTREGGPES